MTHTGQLRRNLLITSQVCAHLSALRRFLFLSYMYTLLSPLHPLFFLSHRPSAYPFLKMVSRLISSFVLSKRASAKWRAFPTKWAEGGKSGCDECIIRAILFSWRQNCVSLKDTESESSHLHQSELHSGQHKFFFTSALVSHTVINDSFKLAVIVDMRLHRAWFDYG